MIYCWIKGYRTRRRQATGGQCRNFVWRITKWMWEHHATDPATERFGRRRFATIYSSELTDETKTEKNFTTKLRYESEKSRKSSW